MKIYVGNLPYSTNDDELRSMFEEFGDVASASIAMDRETGRARGFGFVEMNDDAQARAAMEGLNGKNIGGRDLTVNEARPKTGGFSGGGGGGGGGRGRGGFGGGGGGGGRGGSGGRGGW